MPRTYLDNIDFLRAHLAEFPYAAHYSGMYGPDSFFPKSGLRGWVQASINPTSMLVLYNTEKQRDSETTSNSDMISGFPPGFSFGDPLYSPSVTINTGSSPKKQSILDITREMVGGR